MWKKKKLETTSLLDQAIEISSRASNVEMEMFCAENRIKILEEFESWTKAPKKYRSSAKLIEEYGSAVLSVAQIFMENGDSTLIDALQPKESDNPVDIWSNNLEVAQELQNSNNFADSIPCLEQTISEIEKMLGGTAVDFYLPRAHGLLGMAYYNTGNLKKAVESMQNAKNICEEIGDEDGTKIYNENLEFIVQNA